MAVNRFLQQSRPVNISQFAPLQLNLAPIAAGVQQRERDFLSAQQRFATEGDNLSINHIPDPSRVAAANQVKGDFRGRLDEAMDELMKTGDANRAAFNISRIHRDWQNNPTRQMLEREVPIYEEDVKTRNTLRRNNRYAPSEDPTLFFNYTNPDGSLNEYGSQDIRGALDYNKYAESLFNNLSPTQKSGGSKIYYVDNEDMKGYVTDNQKVYSITKSDIDRRINEGGFDDFVSSREGQQYQRKLLYDLGINPAIVAAQGVPMEVLQYLENETTNYLKTKGYERLKKETRGTKGFSAGEKGGGAGASGDYSTGVVTTGITSKLKEDPEKPGKQREVRSIGDGIGFRKGKGDFVLNSNNVLDLSGKALSEEEGSKTKVQLANIGNYPVATKDQTIGNITINKGSMIPAELIDQLSPNDYETVAFGVGIADDPLLGTVNVRVPLDANKGDLYTQDKKLERMVENTLFKEGVIQDKLTEVGSNTGGAY